MNFIIYKNLYRYKHLTLCRLFAHLIEENGTLREIEIHLHDESNKFCGTCRPNLEIPIIHIYVNKYKKYPYWLCDKYHPHLIRIKTELDFICFIFAHELYHLNGGHRSNFESKNGKTNMRAMEWRCDELAAKAINTKIFKYGEYYETMAGLLLGVIIGLLFRWVLL